MWADLVQTVLMVIGAVGLMILCNLENKDISYIHIYDLLENNYAIFASIPSGWRIQRARTKVRSGRG